MIPELKQDENLELAIYVDDEKQSTIPGKDSGYTLDLEKSSCTYGSISWDSDSWSPVVTVNNEVNGKVRCNLYFKEATAYDECIGKYGSDSLQCNIVASVSTAECPIIRSDNTVWIDEVENTSSYICSAPDDYGVSYYFRGAVTNNYVLFAGYYWRILRINGDDSIRLIYDGTTAHQNGEASEDRQIGISAFNLSQNDNAYVGYMYGTVNSSTYENTHANVNNSTIKEVLDKWYEDHIKNTEYEKYISDTLFCNDRTFNSTNTGTGFGTSKTFYRWIRGPWDKDGTQYPRFNCIQKSDRFTVNDTTMGNGSLNNPIGLITADEALIAGGYNISNSNYYLYTGNAYWTMSSVSFNGSYAFVRLVQSNGSVYSPTDFAYFEKGVRPVINLKPNSLKSGDGTASNPYQV